MDIYEAIKTRHSVRQYEERPIEANVAAELEAEIEKCNKESGLHIQFVKNEPKAFGGFMAHYGNFSGVTNYLAIVGKKETGIEEKAGYWGEKIVLKAQQLGLNTCWVALTYSKQPNAFKLEKGEKLIIVIAIGYGKTQGNARKSKSLAEVSSQTDDLPEWYKNGIEAALLAPTAVNKQRFKFSLSDGNRVSIKSSLGTNARIDSGIVKCHFEIGAGKENFEWA